MIMIIENDDVIVKNMCSQLFSAVDIKAITNSRGFDKQCISNRDAFQHYFYSTVGLDKSIESLTANERIFLFYMGNEWVGVEFFQSLYPDLVNDKRFCRTVTQRYSEIHKAVQKNLLRKGLLLIGECYGDTKIECIRYKVPELFYKQLPAPFTQKYKIDKPGKYDERRVRKLISARLEQHDEQRFVDNMHIDNGVLRLGKLDFSLAAITAWQNEQLFKAVTAGCKDKEKFIKNFMGAFDYLAENEWVTTESLQPMIKFIFPLNETVDIENIFKVAYELGCLMKVEQDNTSYYRAANFIEGANHDQLDPETFLTLKDDGFIIDPNIIPYQQFADLAAVGFFSILNNKLKVDFNFVKLAKMGLDSLEKPLFVWMRKQSALLDDALKQIQTKHGKILLHKNLALLKVNDLRLKAQMIKSYQNSEEVLFLPSDYIAIPNAMVGELEKLIKKLGYAIKRDAAHV